MASLLDRISSYLARPRQVSRNVPRTQPINWGQVGSNLKRSVQPVPGQSRPTLTQNLRTSLTNSLPLLGVFEGITSNKPQTPIGQYTRGQIVNPIREGASQIIRGTTGKERGFGALQAAGGVFSATPVGMAWNAGVGSVAGTLRSARTGQNLEQSVGQGITTPTSIAREGLGVQNPVAAMALDVALTRKPSAIIKDPTGLKTLGNIRKSISGVNPKVNDLHPGDIDELSEIAIRLGRSKKAERTLTTTQRATLDRSFATWFPGYDIDKLSNKQVGQMLAWAIDNNLNVPRAQRTPFPKLPRAAEQTRDSLPPTSMGFAGRSSGAPQKSPARIAEDAANARGSGKPRSVLEGAYADMAAGRKAREEASSVTRSGTLRQRARSQFVDRLSPVYDFVGLSRNAGKVATENNPYRKLRLLAGVSGKAEAYVEKRLAPVLAREKERLDDLSALLTFERERELIGQGLTRRRTLQDLDQGMAELRAKYGPEGLASLQKSAQELRQVSSELLDELVSSGIIDQASYTAMKAKGQFYTPFEAVEFIADSLEKGTFGARGSFNVASQDVVRNIKSYEGAVADPIESLLRKIPKVMALTEKNKALQSLVAMRKQNPDIYADLIVPLKGDRVPPGMNTINVFEQGKNVRYLVPDVVAGAIKNLDAETSGILVNTLSWQAKLLRAGATGLNIAFIPVNVIRDVQDALTTELTENGARAMLQLMATYPQALYSAMRKDDLYRQWQAAGGASSTMTEQLFKRPTKTVRELSGQRSAVKTVISSPRSLIEFANRVGEQSTRLARFKAGTSRTGAMREAAAEAAFKSRDISLDFAKAGNTVKVLNQVIPFLNAGIQGSEKLLRMYRQNPKQAALYTSILYGTPVVLLYQHNSQFADFDDIPLAERQSNWIFITRDRTDAERAAGEPVIGAKIPKGFLGRMVANGVDAGLDFARQRDPESFASALLEIGSGISPVAIPYNRENLGQTLSTILPPGIQAGIEATTNTNLFYGSRIVPQSLARLPAREQYKENTPGIYKAAGQVSGVSPLILENTVNTMTGGVGRQLASLASFDAKGATVDPVTRRFAGIRGGKQADAAWETVEQEKQYTALRNKQMKEAYARGDMAEFKRLSEGMDSQQIKTLITNSFKEQHTPNMSSEERAYDSLTKEERARLLRARPELESQLTLIDQAGAEGKAVSTDNLLLTNDGNVIDLSEPTKGQGIDAFVNKDWKYTKAREVWKADLDPEQKEAVFEKLGVEAEDVRYDYLASHTNDIKTQYILSKEMDHDTLLERLETGRMVSVTGKIFASDGVLDELYERELITYEERKALKAIKLDQKGQLVGKKGGGGSKGATRAQIAAAIGKVRTAASDAQPGQSKRGSTRVTERSLGTFSAPRRSAGSRLVNASRIASGADVDELIRRYAGR